MTHLLIGRADIGHPRAVRRTMLNRDFLTGPLPHADETLLMPGMVVTIQRHQVAMWPHTDPEMTVTLTSVQPSKSGSDGMWVNWLTEAGDEILHQFVRGEAVRAIAESARP